MLETLRRALEGEPDVANALLFGSRARGTERADSAVAVAVELIPGASRDVRALGGLVILDYLDFKPVDDLCAAGVWARPRPVVDRALVAAKIAAVSDATDRVRAVLPPSVEAFVGDRTIREVVTLNLMVAIQDCLDLATHWLADAGWNVPETYGDVFVALAEHDVITR